MLQLELSKEYEKELFNQPIVKEENDTYEVADWIADILPFPIPFDRVEGDMERITIKKHEDVPSEYEGYYCTAEEFFFDGVKVMERINQWENMGDWSEEDTEWVDESKKRELQDYILAFYLDRY